MRRLIDIMSQRGDAKSPRFHIPPGLCVVAVGDMHGHLTPLVNLHQKILLHTKALPAETKKIIVYLGDFIGEGPDSSDILDLLLSAPLPGFEPVYLMGGKELSFLSFIKGEGAFTRWLDQRNWGTTIAGKYVSDETIMTWLREEGGAHILRSYGVDVTSGPIMPLHLAAMRNDLLRQIPVDHIEFLQNLELSYICGQYGFAHAGMNPQLPLKQQNPTDLIRARDILRNLPGPRDYAIVHGEAAGETVGSHDGRINVDSFSTTGDMVALIMMRDKHLFI